MARIFEVVVILLFVAVLLVGANAAAGDDTVLRSATNESITINYSDPVAVDTDAESYEPDATVRNASGDVLENGTDYEWHPSNGTVEWFNTSATTEGNTGTITYEYRIEPESSKVVGAVLVVLGEPIWVVTFITMVLGAWGMAAGSFKGGGGM